MYLFVTDTINYNYSRIKTFKYITISIDNNLIALMQNVFTYTVYTFNMTTFKMFKQKDMTTSSY